MSAAQPMALAPEAQAFETMMTGPRQPNSAAMLFICRCG
jgi:hypothetical protein